MCAHVCVAFALRLHKPSKPDVTLCHIPPPEVKTLTDIHPLFDAVSWALPPTPIKCKTDSPLTDIHTDINHSTGIRHNRQYIFNRKHNTFHSHPKNQNKNSPFDTRSTLLTQNQGQNGPTDRQSNNFTSQMSPKSLNRHATLDLSLQHRIHALCILLNL